ncbi:hypothetical protein G7092_27015 [Mucilaginibacter sp. HC2]|uniref:hypothetical protein n=1 Tax=Mucilaginibacter inviolabilis TaxID=2714892 RepID=UPI0014093E4C|nr:hypothetical protein [Mucilaginibacter inviolabilis]NHA07480.1 hypothetical protein [Mucilaginibacter inviolabilis]
MKHLLFFILFLGVQTGFSQSKLPVIKATSKNVDINDGGYLDKNAWVLSPKIRPDVFTVERTRKTKWVTFYTDIDSIRVKVKPGTQFNFVIVLNGKDSCYTQIASAIPPENNSENNMARHDSISFTLVGNDVICVKTIVNNTDTLNLHFDTGSWNFRLTKDAIFKKTKLLSNQPDALAGKTAPNYNKLNKVFKLQMGNLTWTNPEVAPTDITAHDMDGRFGWNLFESKTVEVNYDLHFLIIHSKPIKIPKGYVRSKLQIVHSFVIAKANFEIEKKKYFGDFLFDTGSNTAIILDSAWISKQNFPRNLKLIKSLVLHNPKGVAFETKVVLAPLLTINSFELNNIPTLILGSKNPAGFEINNFGNEFLKRFNMILDFKNDYLYLKPNKLANIKYRENS